VPQEGRQRVAEAQAPASLTEEVGKDWLVGGIPTPLKNMKVRLDHHPNYWGNLKMFQATNQLGIDVVGIGNL
jgi:hypothetical protein